MMRKCEFVPRPVQADLPAALTEFCSSAELPFHLRFYLVCFNAAAATFCDLGAGPLHFLGRNDANPAVFRCGFQTQIMKAPLENNLFLEFRRPEDKDPVVVLALGFGLCSQPIENSRSKDKAPAVVFIGGVSPECEN